MLLLLLIILILSWIWLSIFTIYQLFFMVIAVFTGRSKMSASFLRQTPAASFCVIIPAHNEELLISGAVKSMLMANYPEQLRTVIVIADNCDDDTAHLARTEGALCYERYDSVLRGKPYALNWLIAKLDISQYDAFIIIDADTRMDADFFRAMDAHLSTGEQAIQGYFGVLNPDENWLTRLAILPGVLKFNFHFPGKMALGLTCVLAGNGMCFSREVIGGFGWNAFSIAENWEYWVQLTLAGYKVTSAADAVIYSQVANSLATGTAQRKRWLKGRIETLGRYGGRLLKAALQGRLAAMDCLMELIRPSYANLMFLSLLHILFCFILVLAAHVSPYWLFLSGFLVIGQVVYFAAGLIAQRAPLLTWLSIAMVPVYLIWKASVSIVGLLSVRDKRWIKTIRHDSKTKKKKNR